jgi:hypothetical protein
MLITIYHNEFHKELEIKEDNSMGNLLEKFLQCCNLLIYNIEYCRITLNINKNENQEIQKKENYQLLLDENNGKCLCSLILGSEELPFSSTVQTIIEKVKALSIEKFELIDRKRDENGNVIKNNIYLDAYQKWYQERESTNYIEYMNNQSQYMENNRNQFLNIFQEFTQQVHDQEDNTRRGNLHVPLGATGTTFFNNIQENNLPGPMFLFQNILNNYNQYNSSFENELDEDDDFEDDFEDDDIEPEIEGNNVIQGNNIEGNNIEGNNVMVENTDRDDEGNNDIQPNLNNQADSFSSTLPQNNRNPYQNFLQNLNNDPSYQEFSNRLFQNLSQSNFQYLYQQSNQQSMPQVHFYIPRVNGSQNLSNTDINLHPTLPNPYFVNHDQEFPIQDNSHDSVPSSESIENNNNENNNENNSVNTSVNTSENTSENTTPLSTHPIHPIRNNTTLHPNNNLNFQQFNQQAMEQFTNELRNNIMNSFPNLNNDPFVQYIDIINHLNIPVNIQESNLENVIVALTDQEFQRLEKKIYNRNNNEKTNDANEKTNDRDHNDCEKINNDNEKNDNENNNNENNNNENNNNENNECMNKTCFICLDNFQENDELIILQCKHNFHYSCIENWLKNHSNKCPTCRKVVADGEPKNL